MASSAPAAPARGWISTAKLLPLLAFYLLFVLLKSRDAFIWDESRYFLGAQNILKGYLASQETLFLWNGPGYPLYLAPILGLGLPLVAAKLGNALFLFLAVARFRDALVMLAFEKGSLAMAYALGIFLFLHGSLIELLMTESLAAYLVCGACYHYLRALQAAPRGPWPHAALAGLHLGYLALTKVFFGYALTACLAFSLLAWLLSRRRARAALSGAVACGFGLLLCLPYLVYTYTLTGKPFFWSNSGGSQLYCMTLTEKELLGDWLNFDAVLDHPEFFKRETEFYRELSAMDYVSRDQAMKQAAIRNLKANPRKYFQNWRANVNRMVFGYPVSRYPGSDPDLATGNRSFVYALPFFLFAFSGHAAWRRRREIPSGVFAILVFAAVSLGGLSLLSAFPRMVFPLLPVLGLWLAAVMGKSGRAAEA